MVDYPTWFGLVQEYVNQQGGSQAQHQNAASVAANIWNQNKATVRGWTTREARDWIQANLDV